MMWIRKNGVGLLGGCLLGWVGFAEESGELLFRSGFEEGVRIEEGAWNERNQMQHLAGRDGSTGYDWIESFREADLLSNGIFQYVISSESDHRDYVTTKLVEVEGPQGEPTRALYLGVKGDDPTQGASTRNELNLFPTASWRQGYARYWMKFQDDLMEVLPERTWLMLLEWKEPRDREATTGGTNNWRANITARTQEDGSLAWHFMRQQVQPRRTTEQLITNEGVPVPTGEWFLVESFWRWGREGRIWFAVDGETVFDQRGRFEHAHNPLGLKFWAVFKNYRGQEWYDADLTDGDEAWQLYDDLEIWSAFPPGHRMADERVLYEESFDELAATEWGDLPDDWWLEGKGSGARARVSDGRLWLEADEQEGQVGTLWLDREFVGDVEVGYDVQVVESKGEVNNMNLFFLFHDARGFGMKDTARQRQDGAYKRYRQGGLKGIILTHLADPENPDQARLRLRQIPQFDPPLAEHFGFHARVGETYRVRVRRVGHEVLVAINGREMLRATLSDTAGVTTGGYIGFRTYQTELWWDNVVVRALR